MAAPPLREWPFTGRRLRPLPSVVPGDGPPPAAGPPTFGQLYSWREIEAYPESGRGEANLPATLDVRGRDLTTVLGALRTLSDRHEALRTRYELDAGVPRVWHDAAAPLPVQVRPQELRGPEEVERCGAELLARAVPMTGGPCWRGEVLQYAGRPAALILSLSHLVVDVWAVRELTGQLQALLRRPRDGGPDSPPPSRLAAEEAAVAEIQWPATRRYWERVLLEGDPVAWPVPAAGTPAPRIQATLTSAALGGLAEDAARRHGVGAPAVVLTAVLTALAPVLDQRRLRIGLMTSNRSRPELRHVVGTLNQLVPLVVDVNPDHSVADQLRQVHWAAVRAYRHARYDVDRVLELAGSRSTGPAAVDPDGFGRLFPAWFNYLQLDDPATPVAPPDDPRAAELVWTPRARAFGQPLDVRVTVSGGRTAVAVRVDPALIPADVLITVLRRTTAVIAAAAGAAAGAGRELRVDALTPNLFPAEVPDP